MLQSLLETTLQAPRWFEGLYEVDVPPRERCEKGVPASSCELMPILCIIRAETTYRYIITVPPQQFIDQRSIAKGRDSYS